VREFQSAVSVLSLNSRCPESCTSWTLAAADCANVSGDASVMSVPSAPDVPTDLTFTMSVVASATPATLLLVASEPM